MSSPAGNFQLMDEAERAIEMWKMKRLVKSLEAAKGNGTSMIR
jgi:peptide chain release factor subunit 1